MNQEIKKLEPPFLDENGKYSAKGSRLWQKEKLRPRKRFLSKFLRVTEKDEETGKPKAIGWAAATLIRDEPKTYHGKPYKNKLERKRLKRERVKELKNNGNN